MPQAYAGMAYSHAFLAMTANAPPAVLASRRLLFLLVSSRASNAANFLNVPYCLH